MVPEFTRVMRPKPMLPAPWIVSWLISVSAVTDPKMRLVVLFDIVTVPPPLNVTAALPMTSSAKFPVEFIRIWPALLMLVPLIVSAVALLKVRLSLLSIVRLLASPLLIFSVTAEACGFPLSMQTFVVAVGTPALQLAAVFHTPPEAGPVQTVPHCPRAGSEIRHERANA